jgi:hypothetical protein
VVFLWGVDTGLNSLALGPGPTVTATYNTSRNANAGGPSSAAADFTLPTSSATGTETASGVSANWVAHTVELYPDTAPQDVTIGNGSPTPDGSYINAGNIALTLGFTNVAVRAKTRERQQGLDATR